MICPICGNVTQDWQFAHRIPQTKRNLERYGEIVIHHRDNLVKVCGLACNDRVSISNHPLEQARLLKRIYEKLAAEQTARVGEP